VQVTSDRTHDDEGDPFPGRHFTWWPAVRLRDVVEGAGFAVESFVDDGEEWIDVEATRARMLADTVGPGMRALIVGLNPGLMSADVGLSFARPGNRFWPALRAAGLATVDRDPGHLLRHHRVGLTDLVKRATVGAGELHADEYRTGLGRVERLCRRHRPGALCLVGLAGWRAAVDRRAVAGWQPEPLGSTPVYLMPSTSGLNAHASLGQLAGHLQAAAAGPAT
jgi:TDG/mug DNA glycosylase family protein